MPRSTESEIVGLLREECEAIKSGAFDALDGLADRKAQLFDDLTREGASRVMLTEIKRQIGENQALLAAAIRGVAAARRRLVELQSVRTGLRVYDCTGQMSDVPVIRTAMERKA